MNSTLKTVAVCLATSLLTALLVMPHTGRDAASAKETVFARIMRTGVIRCGYYVFPPVTYRDPNTGELSGFSVDFMNALADKAKLKVEWTEEVTFGNWIPALEANRYDVACTPMWPDGPMFKAVAFTEPLFYSGISPIVRKDDARFGNDLSRLNQADVTFITQEGNMSDLLTRLAFPNAKYYTLASSADTSDYYLSILSHKADAAVSDRNALFQFNKKNDNALRLVATDKPIKLQSIPMVVGRQEMVLKDFLDQLIREMAYNGETDRMLRKWEPEPGRTYLRTAPPFAPPPPEAP